MSKYEIKVQDNKIIFDGHAADKETCKAITNVCNSLSQTNKTIEYRDGYAEFEVGDVNELKFVAFDYGVVILSSDGTQEIGGNREFYASSGDWPYIKVESHKITLFYSSQGSQYTEVLYENNNINIVGVRTSRNTFELGDVQINSGDIIGQTEWDNIYAFKIIIGEPPRMRHLDKTGLQYFWNKIQSKFLSKNNTVAFTPTADYQPATKKYVDEHGGGATVYLVTWTNEDPQN